MGMRVHESGQDYLSGAVNFHKLGAIFLEPGIAQSIFGLANGDNLAAEAEHRSVFEDGELFKIWSSARARGSRAQRQELADVGK